MPLPACAGGSRLPSGACDSSSRLPSPSGRSPCLALLGAPPQVEQAAAQGVEGLEYELEDDLRSFGRGFTVLEQGGWVWLGLGGWAAGWGECCG